MLNNSDLKTAYQDPIEAETGSGGIFLREVDLTRLVRINPKFLRMIDLRRIRLMRLDELAVADQTRLRNMGVELQMLQKVNSLTQVLERYQQAEQIEAEETDKIEHDAGSFTHTASEVKIEKEMSSLRDPKIAKRKTKIGIVWPCDSTFQPSLIKHGHVNHIDATGKYVIPVKTPSLGPSSHVPSKNPSNASTTKSGRARHAQRLGNAVVHQNLRLVKEYEDVDKEAPLEECKQTGQALGLSRFLPSIFLSPGIAGPAGIIESRRNSLASSRSESPPPSGTSTPDPNRAHRRPTLRRANTADLQQIAREIHEDDGFSESSDEDGDETTFTIQELEQEVNFLTKNSSA